MELIFEGKVLEIRPATSGTSARGNWQKQEVIFEIPSDYSRKVCVIFFNKESEVARLRVGEMYSVSFNIESREYNGRWYTDVRAWRVQPKQEEQPQAAAPAYNAPAYSAPSAPVMPEAAPFVEEPSFGSSASAEVDDLPF